MIPGVGLRTLADQIAVVIIGQRHAARRRHPVGVVVCVVRGRRCAAVECHLLLRAVAAQVVSVLVAPQQVGIRRARAQAGVMPRLTQPRQRVVAVARV